MDGRKLKKKETVTNEDPERVIEVIDGQYNVRATPADRPNCKIEIDVLERHDPKCRGRTHLDELRRPISHENIQGGFTLIDRIGINIPCRDQHTPSDASPNLSETRTITPASKLSLLDTQVLVRSSRKGTHLNEPEYFNKPLPDVPRSTIENVPILRKLGCSSPSFVARMEQKCGNMFHFNVMPNVNPLVYNAGTESTSNPFGKNQSEDPAGSSSAATNPSSRNAKTDPQQKNAKKSTEVTFNNNPSVYHLDTRTSSRPNLNAMEVVNRNKKEKDTAYTTSIFKGQTLKDFIDPCWQKTGNSFYINPHTTYTTSVPPSRLPSNTDEAICLRSLDTDTTKSKERTKQDKKHREQSAQQLTEQKVEQQVEQPVERKVVQSVEWKVEQAVERPEERKVELVDPTTLQNILTPQNIQVLQEISQLNNHVNQTRKMPAVDTSTMTSFTTCCPRPMYRGNYEDKPAPVALKTNEKVHVYAAPSVHKTILPNANIIEPILKPTAPAREPARSKSSSHDIKVLDEVKDNFHDVSSDEDDVKSLAAETEAGTDAYLMNEDDEFQEDVVPPQKKMGFFRKVFMCGCMQKDPTQATATTVAGQSPSERYFDGQSRVTTMGSVRTGMTMTTVPRRDSSFVTTASNGRSIVTGSRISSASRPVRGHMHNKTMSQAWSRKRPNAHPSRRNLTPSTVTRYT